MNKSRFFRVSMMLTSALAMGTGFSFSGSIAMAAQLPKAPYTVQTGDTLYSIAQMVTFPLSDLLKVNHLSMQSTIYPGEELALPFVYKVQQGDALWYLAQKYQTTIAKIKQLNGLKNDIIAPGMKLLIARGSKNTSTVLVQQNTTVSAPAKGTTNTTQNSVIKTVLATPSSQTVSTTINAEATAYDSSVSSNGPWGAVDYFGDPLKFGDIAVDPSVIPLGSKVYISGYSDPNLPKGGFYATAVDTGGAIKGNRIDVYLQSHQAAIDFGIESVKVKVIKN